MNFRPKHFVTKEKTKHHAELLANRVKKMYSHFAKRFRKQRIDCFRLYDWDIPEVRAVVDWYAGNLVIAEYTREQTDSDWLPTVAKAAAEILGVPSEKTFIKKRRTQTMNEPRYKKIDSEGKRFEVQERELKFWVNINDFLDTGLYSDHRNTRNIIRDLSKDKNFLNLYAYTGAFTCAAGAGGARTTTTVDRSATYLSWAKDNIQLNNLWGGKRHKFIHSDVNRFLKESEKEDKKFDLVFVDPPSFFQDKNRGASFDINRDHHTMIKNILKIMVPGSFLFFSTNHQRFEPKFDELRICDLKEITKKTVPEDYRNKQIHRCWQMTSC